MMINSPSLTRNHGTTIGNDKLRSLTLPAAVRHSSQGGDNGACILGPFDLPHALNRFCDEFFRLIPDASGNDERHLRVLRTADGHVLVTKGSFWADFSAPSNHFAITGATTWAN